MNRSHLKLLGPILYNLFWTLLRDIDAKYMYVHNERYCSSIPGKLSHISMKKWSTEFVKKTNDTKGNRVVSAQIKIRPEAAGIVLRL